MHTIMNSWQSGAGLFQMTLTPENLSILLAGVLAVAFDWFPGLAPWFDTLSRARKQQIMLALLVLLASGLFAAACRGWLELGLPCVRESLPLLLQTILEAAGVNQALHLLVKPGGKA